MSIIKKVISILSIICIVALVIYGVIAVPMVAGYKPWTIKDDSLGKDFQKNSLFYYKATEFSDIETNFAVIYSNGEKNLMGVVKSVNKEAGTIDVWTKIVTNGEGKNEGQTPVTIRKDYVVGMAKSMNFPAVGGYFAYINSHVAVIILMGVILALRITFIYIDPDKNTKKAEETESFEQKFNSVFKKDKPEPVGVDSIFSDEKPEAESTVKEAASSVIAEEVKEEVAPVKKTVIQPEKRIPNANDITDYINDLEFDSKDDAWYKADQVDEALDMITAKVYSALNAQKGTDCSSEKDAQIEALREHNAETEKKYLTTEAELAKANEKIAEYEKQIENYKLMEQKVAKLVAAIRASKNNG